ncbi:MAG: serine hydrolase domain-containing protein [Acidimicrobiales bacterium]
MDALRSVGEWPVEHAAAGVARTTARRAELPVVLGTTGACDRPFDWASVTKLATSLAALVAVEEETVSLDEPAGPPGSTLRHLLAHASGLGPEPGPAVAPPGTTRIYSNAGYEVLAEFLEARAGIPFAEYLSVGVLDPLGMSNTVLDPPSAAGAAAGLAGPLVDLLALGCELLAPTLVSADSHREAVTVQFEGLAGVLPGFGRYAPCDWGLGPEIRDDKRPHWTGSANAPSTFGHFGRSGSFLWVDPVAGVVCAGLSSRPFGPWAARAWPALADAVLAEVGGAPTPPDPGR